MRRVVLLAALAVAGLAGGALAAVPQSPQDGQTVTVSTVRFAVDANTNPAKNGQPIEQSVVVTVYSATGAQIGTCNPAPSTGFQMICSTPITFADGSYSWHFTWTRTFCSSSAASSCAATPVTSPTYRFTVQTGTGTTTTGSTTASTTTGATTTVTVTVPAPVRKTAVPPSGWAWFWLRVIW